jgi:hypothetical protein
LLVFSGDVRGAGEVAEVLQHLRLLAFGLFQGLMSSASFLLGVTVDKSGEE